MGGRAARTRAAMDALDAGTRVAMEGHRPGAYLRLRFSGEPATLAHFTAFQNDASKRQDLADPCHTGTYPRLHFSGITS